MSHSAVFRIGEHKILAVKPPRVKRVRLEGRKMGKTHAVCLAAKEVGATILCPSQDQADEISSTYGVNARPLWKDTIDDMISRSEALHRSTDTLSTAEARRDPPTIDWGVLEVTVRDPWIEKFRDPPTGEPLWESLKAHEARPGDLSEHCVDLMRWLIRRWDEEHRDR